ncbi:MAG: BPL-N domain-containing protein [Pseudomonadota bacterium]
MATASLQPARLLWDQGGLWSLFTLRACRERGLAISPISAASLAAGGLAGARLLVVPGGWPQRKLKALGPAGGRAVRDFVRAGGHYLGFCGGAGLALSVDDGLGLLDLARVPRGRRLPSLSGPVWVAPGPAGAGHALWRGLEQPSLLHVWWPAQFAPPRGTEVEVVGVYGPPAPGLCAADLQVDRVPTADWPALEAAYGLRLNPDGLDGQPAMIQARSGRGLVFLSYPHLDTPGDGPGGQALANLWRAWLDLAPQPPKALEDLAGSDHDPGRELARQAQDLWDQGQALGLWRPRHPVMPLWRRGARGLEFWGLRCLVQAVAEALARAAEHQTRDLALLGGLTAALAPLWEQGPLVLAAQAQRLAGREPATDGARLERLWFPAPRRVGGPLGRGLALLETALLDLESRQDP